MRRARAWSALLPIPALAVLCLGFSPSSRADIELPLQSNYESSPTTLTTETIWKLDPEELNPHRMRWLLDRKLEFVDLRAVPLPKKGAGFGIEVGGLYSRVVSYFRWPKDPTYSPVADFPCTESPVSWFATADGSRVAADSAARIWNQLLSRDKLRLEIYLRHARGESAEDAILSARLALYRFQDGLEKEWKEKVLAEARADEWKYYWKRAKAAHACSAPRKRLSAGAENTPAPGPRRWEAMMEPPPESGAQPKLLARAPARRWGGLFSVLVSLKIGTLDLVGKFLIDSAAPQSIISPSFLQNQGAPLALVAIPEGAPRRIRWSGGAGVATPAYIEEAKVSGLVLPIHEFYIHDTDFFGPPESFANCCDGILGADFLRQYSVELRPGRGPEVNIYARDGFRPPASEPWVESYFDADEEVVSDCAAKPAKDPEPARNVEIRGARWDTGDEDAITLEHSPPPGARLVPRWDLSCGPVSIANDMAIEPAERDDDGDSGPPSLVPLDVGMELLGRGDLTFDLGHGRIWFNPQSLVLPVVQNRSGLKAEYVFVDGDRRLKVSSIRRGSPAESLAKAGLRPGMTLLSLDSRSVDDMDTWAVEQYLSGVYGRTVTVEWQTAHKREQHHWVNTSKIAPLKLPGAAAEGGS